jgi:H+/Cl- antiporter ClcA
MSKDTNLYMVLGIILTIFGILLVILVQIFPNPFVPPTFAITLDFPLSICILGFGVCLLLWSLKKKGE